MAVEITILCAESVQGQVALSPTTRKIRLSCGVGRVRLRVSLGRIGNYLIKAIGQICGVGVSKFQYAIGGAIRAERGPVYQIAGAFDNVISPGWARYLQRESLIAQATGTNSGRTI